MNARKSKLTRSQYVMFLMADMMTWCEVGEAFCRKAATYEGNGRSSRFIEAAARLFANEVAQKVYLNGLKIAHGCQQVMPTVVERIHSLDLGQAFKVTLDDMNLAARELVA